MTDVLERRALAGLLAAIIFFVLMACSGGADTRQALNEKKEKGVTAAKQATRHLREARAAGIKNAIDSPEVYQKYRWAVLEFDKAEQAGLDSDIVNDLECALAAFAGDIAVEPALPKLPDA